MSSTLAEQLGVARMELVKPLTIQLAVQGSRSKVNYGTKAHLEYRSISTERYFDIANLQNYDLILGTPFLFQNQVMVGLNDTSVVIGSVTPVPIQGPQVQVLESQSADLLEEHISQACLSCTNWPNPFPPRRVQLRCPPYTPFTI